MPDSYEDDYRTSEEKAKDRAYASAVRFIKECCVEKNARKLFNYLKEDTQSASFQIPGELDGATYMGAPMPSGQMVNTETSISTRFACLQDSDLYEKREEISTLLRSIITESKLADLISNSQWDSKGIQGLRDRGTPDGIKELRKLIIKLDKTDKNGDPDYYTRIHAVLAISDKLEDLAKSKPLTRAKAVHELYVKLNSEINGSTSSRPSHGMR